MNNILGTVYILHFKTPYHHAKHYVGWSDNVEERLIAHKKGTGAKLTQAIGIAGITFILATSFPGTRTDERKIKKSHNTRRYCPICKTV